MEKPKLNSFIKRLLTTLVLVPVVIGCVLGGYPWIYLLALTAAVLLSWEWADMVPNKRPAVYALTYFFVLVAAMIMDSLWAVGVVMALALAVAFVKSKGEENRKLLMLGVPYITIGIGAIVAIYVFGLGGGYRRLSFRKHAQRAETGAENLPEKNMVGLLGRNDFGRRRKLCCLFLLQCRPVYSLLCGSGGGYCGLCSNRRFG